MFDPTSTSNVMIGSSLGVAIRYGAQNAAYANDRYIPIGTEEERVSENERGLDLWRRRLVAGLTATRGRIGSPSRGIPSRP
jgi:hypothetical protein